MKKLLIIGQSVTAVKAVELIRAADQELEILIIDGADRLPVLTERFPDWLARQSSLEHVLYKNERFYHNLRVEFLTGRKIQRINCSRKTVFFDDKSRIEADLMVIAGWDRDDFQGLKGWNRSGFFSLKTAEQIAAFHAMMGRVETVVVESMSLRGAMYAQALAAQNKEVIVCLPGGKILPGVLDDEISEFLILLLEQAGMRIIRNGSLSEVLGDVDVKAVRLDIGKVIAAEAVVFPDAAPDLSGLMKGGLAVSNRVDTDPSLRTNCEGVFAVDEMTEEGARFFQIFDHESLRRCQAARLASSITGSEYSEEPPLAQACVNLSGRELLLIGDLSPEGADALTVRDENGWIRMKIFIKNNVVLGAFLVDNAGVSDHLTHFIKTRQDIDWQNDSFFALYADREKILPQNA